MKISNINFIQPFKNNIKINFKANDLNIHFTKANTDGRWFYTDCSNPSNIRYTDEFCPEEKPETIEYYDLKRDTDGKKYMIPLTSPVKHIEGKAYILSGGKLSEFWGLSYKKSGDEITQKTRYFRGYPIEVIDYKNGEEYKLTKYSQNNHKVNNVYYYDGSFELSQKIAPKHATVELQTLNGNGEKFAVSLTSTEVKGDKGCAQCCILDEDGYKTITLNWGYPVVNYSFSGKERDAKYLKQALLSLKMTLQKKEYNEDFGHTKSINRQLSDAMKYLGDMTEY